MLQALSEGEISPLIGGIRNLCLSDLDNRHPNLIRQKMDLDRPNKDMDWESSSDSSPMEVDKKKKKKKRKKKQEEMGPT